MIRRDHSGIFPDEKIKSLYMNTFTKGLFIIWQQKETLHFKQWISILIR